MDCRGKKSDSRRSEFALYEVISPAFYVIRVFGLAPYEFVSNTGRLRSSSFNCLYSFVWMSIYSFVVVTAIMRFDNFDKDRPVLGITEKAKLILNYLVSVVDLTLGILRREQFVHVWNSIQEFDESIHLDNAGWMVRRMRFWVWASLVFSVTSWTTINQLGMHAFNEPYLQNIGYMLTYVGTCVAVFKFCGIIYLLVQRFAYLNHLIRARSTSTGLVKKVEASYTLLLSTSEKLNDIYSWPLFLFLFNLFGHAVSNMYYFAVWTIGQSYLDNPKVVFCVFTWLLVYLIQMFLLHIACHFVSLEANRMAYLLLDSRRHADRQNKQNEFSSTLHFLNRRLNFTAAGCFNVNLPLLTSTFGHLTTYLVILLQIPDNSN